MRACTLALAIALTTARLSAQGSIFITFPDRGSAATLGDLALNGNGFDPGNAAISVVFTARGAVTATVPVYFANATTIRVLVPPLVDAASGSLFDVPITADLQVVQISASSVITSNVIGGITIEPAPRSGAPAGTVARALLRMTRDLQASVRTAVGSSARFADLVSDSRNFDAALHTLIDAATIIIEDSERSVALPTTDGAPFTLTSAALGVADRVAFAFVKQQSAFLQSAFATATPALSKTAGPPACSEKSGVPELDEDLCGLARQYDRISQVGPGLVQAGAATTYAAPLTLVGGIAAASLGTAGAATDLAATALGYLVGPAASHATAYAVGTAMPSVGSTFTDLGLSFIDNMLLGGIPILSGTNAGVSLASDFEKAANASSGPSLTVPAKGVIVAAAPQGTPSGTHPVMAYQGLGTSATATWLAVPVTQRVTSLMNATLAPPTTARFNGAYSGATRGSCTASVEGVTVNTGSRGPLNFALSDGVLIVTAGGSGSGTVSPVGQLGTVPVSAGGMVCQTSGRFWEDGAGRAGASGSQTCAGPGVSCAGTWSALRN